MALEEVLRTIRGARFSHGVHCPRCGHRDCARYGTARGRQRYRCAGCRRTFNDLTGTPAAFAKKLWLWPRYSDCLDACVSVRAAAKRVGVHPSSAFRWRHRLLGPLRIGHSQHVDGWIELTAAWFAYSEKGRRDLDRPGRSTALRSPWPDARLGVNVVIAADRLGTVVTSTVGRANTRRPAFDEIEATLEDHVGDALILTAEEGSFGPASRFARLRRGVYHDARNPQRGREAHLVHLRNARAYRSRLLGWMKPFRGVATRYLPNYLAWHLLVDTPIRQGLSAATLRWPLSSGFG